MCKNTTSQTEIAASTLVDYGKVLLPCWRRSIVALCGRMCVSAHIVPVLEKKKNAGRAYFFHLFMSRSKVPQ